jgi:uncharacterized protein YvpB
MMEQLISRLFARHWRWVALAGALLVLGAVPVGVAARPAADAASVGYFPWVRQWYSLTCEYAATAAVTWFYGNVVSQRVFIAEVPYSANPHRGFRGRINGPTGGTGDYGIYAKPLIPVLQRYGYHAEEVYADSGWLKAQLRAGRPVVAWMTYQARASTRTRYWLDGEPYSLVPWEHCVVVTAYDNSGVTIMDPYTGTFDHYSWSAFEAAWSYFDNMALLITPAY